MQVNPTQNLYAGHERPVTTTAEGLVERSHGSQQESDPGILGPSGKIDIPGIMVDPMSLASRILDFM
ncbi:hypothetical protein DRQ50_12065 [bacterium]|nr:MAG: hypothetical protein DRQ50_12065 [bacterium]